MKVIVIPIVIGALGPVTKGFGTRIGGLGNNGTRRDYPSYSNIEIAQNTEKSPGDLKRLAITQTISQTSEKPLVNVGIENSKKSQ